MMDLVKRLRDMKMGHAADVACALDDLCIEAADEIERLREVSKSRKHKKEIAVTSRNKIAGGMDYWKSEAERLRGALAILFPPLENRADNSSADHSSDGNLEAVIIDLEMRGANKVCISTLKTILTSLSAARVAYEQETEQKP